MGYTSTLAAQKSRQTLATTQAKRSSFAKPARLAGCTQRTQRRQTGYSEKVWGIFLYALSSFNAFTITLINFLLPAIPDSLAVHLLATRQQGQIDFTRRFQKEYPPVGKRQQPSSLCALVHAQKSWVAPSRQRMHPRSLSCVRSVVLALQ